MWRLLRRNRDFRLLYFGSLISLGGDWFLTVALLDLVLQLTGSATLASLMLLCQTLPIFLQWLVIGITGIKFHGCNHRIRSYEACDVVYVAVSVVADDAPAQPDDV